MNVGYVDKKSLERKGFVRTDDGVYRKLNALERLSAAGWLEMGSKRLSALDRVSVGNRLYRDFYLAKIERVKANDLAKVRVDGRASYATPEEVAEAEDRYRKAIKSVPEGAREIVRRVCLEDREFKLADGMSRHQIAKEKARQATLLCIGLDEIGKFYAGLRKNSNE